MRTGILKTEASWNRSPSPRPTVSPDSTCLMKTPIRPLTLAACACRACSRSARVRGTGKDMSWAAGGLAAQDMSFPVPRTRAELEQALHAQAAKVKGRIGVFIKHVESGETVGLGEGDRFQLCLLYTSDAAD